MIPNHRSTLNCYIYTDLGCTWAKCVPIFRSPGCSDRSTEPRRAKGGFSKIALMRSQSRMRQLARKSCRISAWNEPIFSSNIPHPLGSFRRRRRVVVRPRPGLCCQGDIRPRNPVRPPQGTPPSHLLEEKHECGHDGAGGVALPLH
jgi:hypothetical protein